MNILNICGTAILAVLITLLFRQIKSDYYVPLILLFGFLLLNHAIELFSEKSVFLESLFQNTPIGEFQAILLKVFGISLVVETTADICRDAGESSIASKIELIGKAEMLFISIPLIERILEITKEIML